LVVFFAAFLLTFLDAFFLAFFFAFFPMTELQTRRRAMDLMLTRRHWNLPQDGGECK
jgi:hypothetical protein